MRCEQQHKPDPAKGHKHQGISRVYVGVRRGLAVYLQAVRYRSGEFAWNLQQVVQQVAHNHAQDLNWEN